MKSFSDLLPPETIVTGKDYFKNNYSKCLKLSYENTVNTDLLQKSTESH